jgi:hypothetical protein
MAVIFRVIQAGIGLWSMALNIVVVAAYRYWWLFNLWADAHFREGDQVFMLNRVWWLLRRSGYLRCSAMASNQP